MMNIDLKFIRGPSYSVLEEEGITMLCKEEGGGTNVTTMARPLEAEARACCPCGITHPTCLVQVFFHAGFDKMCTSITAFDFFVHGQGGARWHS